MVEVSFSLLDWSAFPYNRISEIDPTTAGGTAYTITGTSQLLSVPYALHSKSAENGFSGNYADWYLPSKYELNLLYLQKTVVGSFDSSDYLSSTETNHNLTWFQNFCSGNRNTMSKVGTGYVRAVRAF